VGLYHQEAVRALFKVRGTQQEQKKKTSTNYRNLSVGFQSAAVSTEQVVAGASQSTRPCLVMQVGRSMANVILKIGFIKLRNVLVKK